MFGVEDSSLYFVGEPFDRLFREVLIRRHALVELSHLKRVRKALGRIPDGKHYATIVSPLLGGTSRTSNWHFETAKVHLVSAAASRMARKAIQAVSGD